MLGDQSANHYVVTIMWMAVCWDLWLCFKLDWNTPTWGLRDQARLWLFMCHWSLVVIMLWNLCLTSTLVKTKARCFRNFIFETDERTWVKNIDSLLYTVSYYKLHELTDLEPGASQNLNMFVKVVSSGSLFHSVFPVLFVLVAVYTQTEYASVLSTHYLFLLCDCYATYLDLTGLMYLWQPASNHPLTQ